MALSLCYLGLCRLPVPVCSSCRAGFDQDIELMVPRHKVRILERQVPGRVRLRRGGAAFPEASRSGVLTRMD